MDVRPFSVRSSKHTFLDLITAALSEEDKQKIIHVYHEKGSLLSASLLETYLSCQPLLLSISLVLLFLALSLFCVAVVVATCRLVGRCGGRRYQPHPSSSRRFVFLTVAFLFSWLLLASSSLNFLLSAATFYGRRNPTQLLPVPLKTSVDYPDYGTRGKRESVLTALFNDPNYDGDFESVDEPLETTTTVLPSFIQEGPRKNIPIGGHMVVVTTNGEINERATTEREEEEDEEYIEGDEDDEEDDVTTVSPTTHATRHHSRSSSKSPATTTVTPTWKHPIGQGSAWAQLLREEKLPLQHRVHVAQTNFRITTSLSSSSTTTPPFTTRARTGTSFPSTEMPSSSRRYVSFKSFTTEEESVPSTVTPLPPLLAAVSSSHSQPLLPPPTVLPSTTPTTSLSPLSNEDDKREGDDIAVPLHPSFHRNPTVPADYFSISNDDDSTLPISIGQVNGGMKKEGRAAVSLLNHRRPFESMHSEGFRALHRFFGVFFALLLSLCTLPTLLLVLMGAMHYVRSFHPMDRSKMSDRVGLMCVVMGVSLLFLIPLLLIHVSVGLVLSHVHHALCPLVQPPTDTLEEMVLVLEGCSRVQTPLIRMWQSSLLAAISALPVAVLLLQLSKYFLRMRSVHYWTQSEVHLM